MTDALEKRLDMRRPPQQARSQSTVDFIKQAALDIIERQGIAACRTDAIAERAGVSIGSLYKYFPNREAILKALYEDASIAYAHLVGTLTLQVLDWPTERGMGLTMRSVVALHRRHHLILQRLADEMPEMQLAQQPMSFHNLVRNHIRAYVQHRNPRLKPAEVRCRSFFIEHIVFSCIEGYLSDAPTGMSFGRFTRNLAQLIADIIDRPLAGSASAPTPAVAPRRVTAHKLRATST